jgi:hypothetical protein
MKNIGERRVRFEAMNAKQRVAVTIAGMGLLGLGLVGASNAQGPQKAAPKSTTISIGDTASNLTIVDATPNNQTWPRYHVVYNSAKNTATYLEIGDEGIEVRSVVSLDKVTPRKQQ